jgi:hypothetical protein
MSRGSWIGAGLIGGSMTLGMGSAFASPIVVVIMVILLAEFVYFPAWAVAAEAHIGSPSHFMMWAVMFYLALLACLAMILVFEEPIKAYGALCLFVLLAVSFVVDVLINVTVSSDKDYYSQQHQSHVQTSQGGDAQPVNPLPSDPHLVYAASGFPQCGSLDGQPVQVTTGFSCTFDTNDMPDPVQPVTNRNCGGEPVFVIFGPTNSGIAIIGKEGSTWLNVGSYDAIFRAAMAKLGCK